MAALNKVVKQYLAENGIMVNHFAEYIGCSQSRVSKWFKGEIRLNSVQIQKTHEFLRGNFLKPVKEIMKEE